MGRQLGRRATPPGRSPFVKRRRQAHAASARYGADSATASFEDLRGILLASQSGLDLSLLERAYEVAARWHSGQRRRSGDPYITHPLAVAKIVAELGMSQQVVCAALLHDVLEDTSYTFAELRAEFGDEVAALVEGVCDVEKLERLAAEIAAKDHTTGGPPQDTELLALKLADRLHNMRTIRWLAPIRQEAKSRQTLDIFVPLAHQLGMDAIQHEFAGCPGSRWYCAGGLPTKIRTRGPPEGSRRSLAHRVRLVRSFWRRCRSRRGWPDSSLPEAYCCSPQCSSRTTTLLLAD
jgi:guanosine-3',5'-bis(diphosphate) 3'-pyrophosphohydrolase